MILKEVKDLCKKYDIPENVQLFSDSGWELDETPLNTFWFSRKANVIIFKSCNETEFYKLKNWEDKPKSVYEDLKEMYDKKFGVDDFEYIVE